MSIMIGEKHITAKILKTHDIRVALPREECHVR